MSLQVLQTNYSNIQRLFVSLEQKIPPLTQKIAKRENHIQLLKNRISHNQRGNKPSLHHLIHEHQVDVQKMKVKLTSLQSNYRIVRARRDISASMLQAYSIISSYPNLEEIN